MRKLSIVILSLILSCSMVFAAPKELKVGFIYVSPIGDAGWSFAHDQGRQAVAAWPSVTTSYVESVAEGPDSERVILNMASKGLQRHFRHLFRLHGFHAQSGQAVSGGCLRTLFRFQVGQEHGQLFRADVPGALPVRHGGRLYDQIQHLWGTWRHFRSRK